MQPTYRRQGQAGLMIQVAGEAHERVETSAFEGFGGE